jgi:hypothetical protein
MKPHVSGLPSPFLSYSSLRNRPASSYSGCTRDDEAVGSLDVEAFDSDRTEEQATADTRNIVEISASVRTFENLLSVDEQPEYSFAL